MPPKMLVFLASILCTAIAVHADGNVVSLSAYREQHAVKKSRPVAAAECEVVLFTGPVFQDCASLSAEEQIAATQLTVVQLRELSDRCEAEAKRRLEEGDADTSQIIMHNVMFFRVKAINMAFNNIVDTLKEMTAKPDEP